MKYWVLFCANCGASFCCDSLDGLRITDGMELPAPEKCCNECNVVFRRGNQLRDSSVVGEYEDDKQIDLDPSFDTKPKPVDKHIDRFDSILDL
jgi:hypothetical protein